MEGTLPFLIRSEPPLALFDVPRCLINSAGSRKKRSAWSTRQGIYTRKGNRHYEDPDRPCTFFTSGHARRSTSMAPTLTRQHRTADAYVAAFNAMDIDAIAKMRAPNALRHILPSTLGHPPFDNAQCE